MQSDLEYQLEMMVDKHGLTVVLEAMQNVCFDKGDHLRTNWQDEASAEEWEDVAWIIDTARAEASRRMLRP